jgi:hypothetical protein
MSPRYGSEPGPILTFAKQLTNLVMKDAWG